MQEEIIKFLTEYRKYRVFCWGFGPTLLEDLCRKLKFDVKEFLAKKDIDQCVALFRAFGERKIYWWWPWSKKVKDSVFDAKDCRRAFEYHNYLWFWRVILGLFTPVLAHRQIFEWIDINCRGYMYMNNYQSNATRNYAIIAANLRTVGGTLKLLGFSQPSADGKGEISLLQKLDDSLEMVRRNIKSREEHEQFVSEVDKKMRELSREIHPDKVMSRGGSEKEVAEAQEKQAALTACRALIKNISKIFLDHIHIDFEYGCYSNMKIDSLGNTRALNQLNLKIFLELAEISKIKQEEIITNINKFLKASDESLNSFIVSKFDENKKVEFEQHRSDALYYLTLCITGRTKLQEQYNSIIKKCKHDTELKDLLRNSISNTLCENTKQLNQLKGLEEFAESALQGKIGRMSDMKDMDGYMILPLAAYVNTLSVCSVTSVNKPENTYLFLLMLKQFWSYILSLFSNVGSQQDGAHKVLSHLISHFCQEENIQKEENINKVIGSIVTVRGKLAEIFSPDNYQAITIESWMEESRKLEKRIDEFTKQVEEDLIRARKIIEDQDKIARDQEKIREEIQNFKEVFTVFEEKIKLIQNAQKNAQQMEAQPNGSLPAQPPPSGSLSNVEPPHHHSQSMSRN